MIAITNAEIFTITKGRISKGTLVFDKGRITAVGKAVRVPQKAQTIDAQGRILTPGLIEAHSHAGMAEDGFFSDGDYNESTDPVTPHLMAIDGFKPTDIGLREAAVDGITTMFVTPGSANVFCGMGAIVKTWAPTFDQYVVNPAAGLKMATGENPKRVYGSKGKTPSTRMGIGGLLRETFTEARNYLEKKAAHTRRKKKNADPFTVNLKHEAIGRVLGGKIPARCHSHRAIDMLTFMRVADEFKFKYTFEHATEAIDILDELKARKVPVIVGPTLGSRPKVELLHKTFNTVAAAVEAGLLVAITSDHHVLPMRYLPVYAALAVRAGLDPDEALKAITINPARILGIDQQVGSLEKGKQADLVLWNGDPLDARSQPDMVFIGGRQLDREAEFKIP